MSEGSGSGAKRDADSVGDSLRIAIERTLEATAGSAASTRERAGELVDEVVKLGRGAGEELARRGQGAREGLARRGQEAGAEISRRGQEAGAALGLGGQDDGELARQLEVIEARLAALERKVEGLAIKARAEGETEKRAEASTKPKAEG